MTNSQKFVKWAKQPELTPDEAKELIRQWRPFFAYMPSGFQIDTSALEQKICAALSAEAQLRMLTKKEQT